MSIFDKIGGAVVGKILRSRKGWGLIVGIVVSLAGKHLGLDPEGVREIMMILGTYIIGQGIADHGNGGSQ